MSIFEVAERLVGFCRDGRFVESGEALWSEDVVSFEPFTGDMAALKGREALRAKAEWWIAAHEIHGIVVEGPFYCGDSFLVRFIFDLTDRKDGVRRTLDEVGVYEVKDDKIVSERFFVPKSFFQA